MNLLLYDFNGQMRQKGILPGVDRDGMRFWTVPIFSIMSPTIWNVGETIKSIKPIKNIVSCLYCTQLLKSLI